MSYTVDTGTYRDREYYWPVTQMETNVLYWNGPNLFVHQLWEYICDYVGRDVQCPRHVERNNYVPLFGVDPIECRLTLLRNKLRDCYLNIVVPL